MHLKEFDLVFRIHAYIFTQISRYFHCILIVFLYLNNIQQRLVAPFVMRKCKCRKVHLSAAMPKGTGWLRGTIGHVTIALSGTLKSRNKQINKKEQGFKKFIRNVFHCTNQLTKCFALFGVIYTNILVSMIKSWKKYQISEIVFPFYIECSILHRA